MSADLAKTTSENPIKNRDRIEKRTSKGKKHELMIHAIHHGLMTQMYMYLSPRKTG